MIAMDQTSEAEMELRALGQKMMAALSWTSTQAPDWDTFRSLFHVDARLVPAARPVTPIPVEAFIERMEAQRMNGSLADFKEAQLSLTVHVFGNVASVFQAYSTVVNEGKPGQGISAMVWVNDGGRWQCINMAWDAETPDKHISVRYLKQEMKG